MSQIGLIGLGTMGVNLARNIANKGFSITVFNRTFKGLKDLDEAKTLKKFVKKLEKPRKIILMIKAGDPVDEIITQLTPLLEKNDIIIDSGNSNYNDTNRRQKKLAEKGLHLIGMGISGGEKGALEGPSLMPGGNKDAYKKIKNILEKIAADDGEGGKCVIYIGENFSGHFVKMVHNGIEYGIMQVIAESYDILKNLGGYSNKKISKTFAEWDKEENSFLLKITEKILSCKDNLIDLIKDTAEQKGTGKWTVYAAFDLGVAIPTISAAVNARILSGDKNLRGTKLPKKLEKTKIPKNLTKIVKDALKLSIICAYVQGFELLKKANMEFRWELDISEIARIWRGGCIIRANSLRIFQKTYGSNKIIAKKTKEKLLKYFKSKAQNNWRKTIILSTSNGIPLPSMSASLLYYDTITADKLPQNLIQAQRDFFGAHTYERIDKKGTFHTNWDKNLLS